jgi:hypothetical protein
MFTGKITPELGALIDSYQERFRKDPRDGFSLFETALGYTALFSRLERALAEGVPYDPRLEEWDPEFRRQVDAGEIVL